jgi:hypothetical protein
MVSLKKKLKEILETEFDGATFEPEKAMPNKIAGFLIWGPFQGKEQIKRQRDLWKVLEEKLTTDELSRVSTILTLTPEEMPLPQSARPRRAV